MSEMKKIIELIKSDYYRYNNIRGGVQIALSGLLCRNHCFSYTFWLRLASNPNPFCHIARIMHKRLSRKYGIQIPPGTNIGYGFYIGHGVSIIINGSATIGNNCNISQCVTIGANEGNAATIGDNVYIGPGVCIVEDVHIGNNVTIGAGAVVVRDIPDNATVAGVPARILNFNKPARYIRNRWKS